jgi:hypothetical protein
MSRNVDGGDKTPISDNISMEAKLLNNAHVSQKMSSDSMPRTETFNPFQTIHAE